MRRALALTLTLSLAVNLYLLLATGLPWHARADGSAAGGVHPRAARPYAVTGPEGDSLRAAPGGASAGGQAERTDIERQLAEAQARLDLLTTMEPTAALVYRSGDLRAKLRAIAALPEGERTWALAEIGRIVEQQGPRISPWDSEIMRIVAEETEPTVLGLLAKVLGAVGAERRSALVDQDATRRLFECLREGELPERRLAAAWLLGAHARVCHWEAPDEIVGLLRQEKDAQVLATLAREMAPEPEHMADSYVAVLRDAVDWLPGGKARRDVLSLVGRATFERDGGQALYDRWLAASAQEIREDVAAALPTACAGLYYHDSRMRSDPERIRDTDDRKRRFLAIYESTATLATRQRLTVAAIWDLDVTSGEDEAGAALLRDLAARERDPDQRQRLVRLSEMLDQENDPGVSERERILCGK